MDIKHIQRMSKTRGERVTKKRERLTPDQLGYQDRGMMKWQGLMLSDHTEAIKKRNLTQQAKQTLPKAKLSLVDIGKKLAYAYENKIPIRLQTNTLKDGQYFQEYDCLVIGYYEDTIYFSLKNGHQFRIPLENIRHIERLDPFIWQI